MHTNINKLALAMLLPALLMAGACQKNFLNKGPLAQYSDDNVWKDSSLISRFVDGIYGNIICTYDWPGNNYGYNNVGILPADFTDEAKSNFPGSDGDLVNLGQYTPATKLYIDHFWSYPSNTQTGVYENVRNCNLFLSHLGDLPLTAAGAHQLKGEVLFLRAYNYQYLYSIFGRFPIIDSVLTIGDDLNKPRGTDADCIAFILKDLDSAAAILPTSYTATTDLGRATKGAALGMECRILLNQKRYSDAAAVAKAVMDLGIYSLFDDYEGMFYPGNDDNSEVIFNKEYGGDLTGQTNNLDLYENSSFFSGFGGTEDAPTQNIVDQYLMTDGLPWDQSPLYDPAHPYANRDPRLTASIIYDGSTWMGNTIDLTRGSAYNPSTGGGTVTGYLLRKFLDPNYNFYGNNTNYGNCIILRLAEIYLDYAECELQLGNAEEARTYVNKLRERASVHMPDIPAGQMTWDLYQRERTVELAFEGERFADIRRWDMGAQLFGADIYGMTVQAAGGVRTYTRTHLEKRWFDPKMYLFPIPLVELTKYPAGQQLEQNPGW